MYLAYLNRGDAQQQRGDVEGALEDYNAALTLNNVPDLSKAQEKQAQALQNLRATPTPPPPEATETEPPTSEPEPTSLPEPTAVPTPTPASEFVYMAPRLLNPEPYALYAGEFAEIILDWESVGALAENEYYDVTIRYFMGEEPRYWGSGLIKETSWRVPLQAGYGQAGKDELAWWVTVRVATGADQSQPISPASEERTLIWKP